MVEPLDAPEPFELLIAGAGGFGREVLTYAREIAAAGRLPLHPLGFLDDTGADPAAFGCDLPVVSTIVDWRPGPRQRVVVAVGDPGGRRLIAERLTAVGARFATLVHPTAWVAPNARLTEGILVAPLAAVGPGAVLHPHALINVHAGIGHDATVGRWSVISPQAVLNGFATVGEEVLVGSGAVILARQTVGAGARVAAGSVVYAEVPPGTTAHGNPARAMRLPPAAAAPGSPQPV